MEAFFMHKLVILIDAGAETPEFGELWPQFLHLAESMPGLLREATSRVDRVLFGSLNCSFIHELFFADYAALQKAMTSPQGVQAGQVLQHMSRGRVVLLLADHKEDEIANLKKYRSPPEPVGDEAG
jgi:predicted small integral membrane protein